MSQTLGSPGTATPRNDDAWALWPDLSCGRYKAVLQYGLDQIEEYHRMASEVNRPAELDLVDPRLSVALFFVNGLTAKRLSTLELGVLSELSQITKTIVVIGKADCLLQEELEVLRSSVL